MLSITALLFLALFFLGCYATLFHSPYFGILLYQVQYFANPPARWWYGDLPDLRYSFTIVFLIVISLFLHHRKLEPNPISAVPQGKWLVLMMLLLLATYFWAVSPVTHADFIVRFLKVAVFALLAYKLIDTPKKMEALLGVYLAGIFYISWVAWQVGRSSGGRVEGIGGADTTEVNGTAAVVVTAVPLLTFYILFGKTRWVKLASLGALAFVLNGLVLLNSRGAFLAMIISGLYFAFHVFKEKGHQGAKKKIIAGVIGCAALFLYLADDVFWSRMNTLENIDPEEGSGHRVLLWMKTFEMLRDHPLGAGARGYHMLSAQYLPPEWLSGGMRAVHSTWFEVLSEYGYHGFAIFIGYILSSFIFLRKVRKHLRSKEAHFPMFQSVALEAAFIGLLVAGSFINFFYGELMYWLPFYIAAFGNIYLLKDAKGEAPGKRLGAEIR